MEIKFYNCPKPETLDRQHLPPKADFITYKPDFSLMGKFVKDFEKYKNILIIGHGGSVTSFYGFYNALGQEVSKKAYFLSSTDPDYIYELKKQLKPTDTLVIPISKSGETTTQIEALMQFAEYPILAITGKASTLRAITEKLSGEIYLHPTIGGRYTGITEVGLLPAAICGINVEGLYNGAKKWYEQYEQENLAWKTASVLWQLEQQGFVDVFMPFYSRNLFFMSNIIIQLCHESFGKAGLGQTYFAHEAPESQHHTNQRFFGGRKNICGFFNTVENFNHPTQNVFPPSVHSVQIKEHAIFDINKIPLEKSMEFEAQGTIDDANIHSIPIISLSILNFSPEEIGGYLAFWQLFAVYSSYLRKVDPFDQPQVENSKVISFNKRLTYKGLL